MFRDVLRSQAPRSIIRFARRLRARISYALVTPASPNQRDWDSDTKHDNSPTIMYHQSQSHAGVAAAPVASNAQCPYFIAVDFAPAEVRGILDTTDFDLFEFHSPTVGWRHLPPPPPPPPRAAIKSVWGAPPTAAAATIASHLPPWLIQNSGYHMTLCAMKRPGEYDVPLEHLEPLFHRSVDHGTIVARSVVITDAIAAVQLEIVAASGAAGTCAVVGPAGPGLAAAHAGVGATSAAVVDAATLAAAAVNRHPHVTLALDRKRGIKPAHSNTMLELLENAVAAAVEQQQAASPATAASSSSVASPPSASDSSSSVSSPDRRGSIAAPPRAYAHQTATNGGARFACPVAPGREQMPLFEPLRVAVLRNPVVLKSGIVVPH